MNRVSVATTRPARWVGLTGVWEDPEHPFGCEPRDLHHYAERGDWVMLFNAIMINVMPERAE